MRSSGLQRVGFLELEPGCWAGCLLGPGSFHDPVASHRNRNKDQRLCQDPVTRKTRKGDEKYLFMKKKTNPITLSNDSVANRKHSRLNSPSHRRWVHCSFIQAWKIYEQMWYMSPQPPPEAFNINTHLLVTSRASNVNAAADKQHPHSE